MSEERIPTSEKLARALEAAGAPAHFVAKARNADYDDYRSTVTATPCVDLVRDLGRLGLTDLRARAMAGEFDAQQWESDAWAESMKNDPEVGPMLKTLGLDRRRPTS